MPAGAGSLAASGVASGLRPARLLAGAAGAFLEVGTDVTLRKGDAFFGPSEPASFAVGGFPARASFTRVLAAGPASFDAGEVPVGFNWRQNPNNADVEWEGLLANLVLCRRLPFLRR
jgi:hypothetical protein